MNLERTRAEQRKQGYRIIAVLFFAGCALHPSWLVFFAGWMSFSLSLEPLP